MTIAEHARLGLVESGSCRWRFWKRTELNAEAAEQALDRIERAGPAPEQAAVLRMARVAEELEPGRKLAVMREAMRVLTARVAGDLCGLAGVALRLSEKAGEPEVDRKLAALLPDPGTLGKVAPDAGWLLSQAARPMPSSGAEWAETLAGCPRSSVQAALQDLASPETRSWLEELRDFPRLEELERTALAHSDQKLPPHRWALALAPEHDPEGDLARWALGKSPAHPWKTLAGQLPGTERLALEHLDGPLDARQAARLLADEPGAAARLAALCPEDGALALLAGLPEQAEGLRRYAQGHVTPATWLRSMLDRLPPERALASIRTDDPLLGAVVASPWDRPVEQARVAVAGWCAAEQPAATPASLGLAMARATEDLEEKRWLARSALKAAGQESLLRLTELDGTNATWCQTALGLGALRALERHPAGGPRALIEVVLEASTTWASPAWRETLSDQVAGEVARASDPLVRALGQKLDQHANRQVLLELAQVLEDRVLGQQPGEAAVAERGNHLLVGGVRLERRIPGSAPLTELEPAEAPPLAAPAALVLDPPPQAGVQVGLRRKDSYKTGVGGVYNPVTGELEWKECYKSGVAGAYDPDTGRVEWRESYKSGVGVVRKSNGALEWKEAYKTGVVGVEQPDGSVRWSEHYKSGVGKCQRPDGSWEIRSAYKSGIAGVWNEEKQAVDWHESYKSGLAFASSDPEKPTLITVSSISLGYDD